MEENSTTMNLGNLQAGGIPATEIPATSVDTEIVAPVSDLKIDTNPISVVTETLNQTQVSVASEQSNLSQQLPEQPAAPVFTQTSIQTQPATVPPTPPTESNTIEKKIIETVDQNIMKVKTSILQTMLDNVLKVVNYDPRFELNTIVQLIFSARGLETKSANGIETYIYQKNSEWTYSTLGESSICLDSQFLQKLVSKITKPEIIFERSKEDSKIILIKTGKTDEDTAEYRLTEKLDPSTGETINIEMPVSFDNVKTVALTNYDTFKNNIDRCIPFTTESTGLSLFNGVYCNGNYIIGSNGDTICIRDSVPELKDALIYIKRDFASKFISVNLNGKIDIAWVTTEGRVYPSVMQLHSVDEENKSEIIMTGVLQEDEYYTQFPIDAVNQFKQMQFNQTYKTSRTAFKEAIDRTSLFFRMVDQNQLIMTITPGNMNLKSLSGGSDENIQVTESNQALNAFRIDATQANKMLDNLSTNEVTIKADNEHPHLISVIDQDCLIIMSEANGV